jgi:DNA/RNA-binding domain of Phe-tRNA-synthetase-like protein
MRKAVRGEPFHGIGMRSADSLSGVEVVIEDQGSHGLIAVYPYRDSDDSKITEGTTDILFMICGVPGIDDAALKRADSLTKEYIGRFCLILR